MVQNQQTRLCTEFAITSGTSQTPDQYRLTVDRTQRGAFGLSTNEGARDIGVGSPLYLRFRVTESFNQPASTLNVVPTIASTVDMTAPINIEHYRAPLSGAALIAGSTWHFPLRPLSAAEVLDPATGAPIWPIPLSFIGCKFIVTGTAFTTGRVTCDITPHVSPDAIVNILGATIPPKMPVAGW